MGAREEQELLSRNEVSEKSHNGHRQEHKITNVEWNLGRTKNQNL